MAVQLGVNLGGLELKSPLVVAAGDTGCHIGQIKEAEKYGAAAFITKGCIPRAGASGLSRKPRFRVDFKTGTLSGKAGPRRLSLEQAKRLISDAKKEVRIPVGANIFAMSPTDEEKEIVTAASRQLYESGADFIELDTSGNLPHHFGETDKEGKTGEYFMDDMAARYFGFVYETIKSVKKVVSVPVMAKVAFANMNVPALIQTMEKAGADIIDIGNTSMGVVPGTLDIYNPGKMGKGFVSANKSMDLILSGDALRHISQAYLIRSARSLKTPILGCGGIMDWRHVVEAIMCGATATAACTVFMVRGFEALSKMEQGLKKFMEEQGYSSVAEFRGAFIDKIALNVSEIDVCDALARVDPAKCNGCGLCLKPAHCGLEKRAISLVDKKAVIDEAQCVGCETCASICPVNAITIVLKQ